MAHSYQLVCFDCKVSLSFGKVYTCETSKVSRGEVRTDGLYDDVQKTWRRHDQFFGQVFERFLLLHRNHALRFVPEGVDELVESSIGFIPDVSPNEVLLTELAEDVDAESELDRWKLRLKLLLRSIPWRD